MWEEMLEVRQIDMEDFFTPCGLHRYTGVEDEKDETLLGESV